jgi:hypothetical protein
MSEISQETKLGVLFMIIVGVVTVGYLWYKSWAPGIMDEGPLMGESIVSVPSTSPSQSFDIYNNLILEVYDMGSTQGAPVISMSNGSGERLWTVLATSSKKDPKVVEDIRFSGARSFPFVSPRVRGDAVINDATTTTWWFITKKGELTEYWYER